MFEDILNPEILEDISRHCCRSRAFVRSRSLTTYLNPNDDVSVHRPVMWLERTIDLMVTPAHGKEGTSGAAVLAIVVKYKPG